MPPSPESERATGRPVQALPNTLIVKRLAALDRFKGNPASFTRLVASFRSPASFERTLQSNPAGLFRQPLESRFFFDFRQAVPLVNSFNLNRLGFFVKGLTASLRRLARPPPPFGRQP